VTEVAGETPSTVVLVPVLRRPGNVVPLLESLAENTPEPHRVLFLCTRGDRAELDEVRAAGADHLEFRSTTLGDYARKINAGYRHTADPFLFLGADDLRFHPGWLAAALDAMSDPSIGVVGTNDLGNIRTISGDHATHSLVRRTYVDELGTIDQPGLVLHEGYPHEFVDDEFVETARLRRAFVSRSDSVVEHLHPLWGKAPTDTLYRQQHRRMRSGRVIYNRRRHLWTSPS
jgi:glycosyltransferase involved in cell wall biosynthesis